MTAMQLYPEEIHAKFLLNHRENLLIKKNNSENRVSYFFSNSSR